MKAIIPIGGRGTRMRPLTFSANKHFIPLANKPIIFYPIEAVANAGIKEIAVTFNPEGKDEARSILGDGSRWGLKFTYVLQEQPKGLANIFQVCEQFLKGESFVLHLGDNIFVSGIKDLVDFFVKEQPNALLTYLKHPDNKRLGVPFFDERGKLKEYVEKPENPPNDFGIPGLYFFDREVFNCFKGQNAIKPSARGELEISAPYNWLLDNGFRVEAKQYQGKWMDPGKFDDWLSANEYLLKYSLGEKVIQGKDTQVRNSKIKGPVIIGDKVIIENSEIGPGVSIADNCQISNSKISDSVLMSGVRISGVLDHPLQHSLIGTDTEVVSGNGREAKTSLFVGEKCKIQV